MKVKTSLASAVVGAAIATSAGSVWASTIVDISALNGDGTTVSLAAGDYTVGFIDVANGGAYGGYNPWSNVSGCDGGGMNCSNGFIENLAIDFGHGTGTFNRSDGVQNGMHAVSGNNFVFATGAQALAAIQAGPIYQAPITQYSDPNAYAALPGPITFHLAQTQSVNFFIIDYPYNDNTGGVSIRLTSAADSSGAPEPAAWALMVLGMGGLGAGLRAQRSRRTAAA